MSNGDWVILVGMLVVLGLFVLSCIDPWIDKNFRKCPKCKGRMKYLGTKVAYAMMIPIGGFNHFFRCEKCGYEYHYYESDH